VTVNCRETRELADPFLSDQLLVETTHEIVRHLETCATCRDEFAARGALRAKLQAAIAASPGLAPRPDFAAELAARLRPAPSGSATLSRRAWLETWWAAAAAVIALLGGGLFARDAARKSRLATLAASAAGDHQNCAIRFNLAERPIPLDAAAKQYDPAYAALATLEAPGGLAGGPATVLDRHSCVFEGRRFGHVVYRYEDRVVSLLVTAESGAAGSTPALVRNDSPLRVAAFDAGTHDAFVVSDLSGQDVLAVARALASPLARRVG
jgi:anti-sigma factor RsiW